MSISSWKMLVPKNLICLRNKMVQLSMLPPTTRGCWSAGVPENGFWLTSWWFGGIWPGEQEVVLHDLRKVKFLQFEVEVLRS